MAHEEGKPCHERKYQCLEALAPVGYNPIIKLCLTEEVVNA